MGLLDDAIREHLDLKRRRGADPSEIERLEREALGPVRRAPHDAPELLLDEEIAAPGGYPAEEEPPDWDEAPHEPPVFDRAPAAADPGATQRWSALEDEDELDEGRGAAYPADEPPVEEGGYGMPRHHEIAEEWEAHGQPDVPAEPAAVQPDVPAPAPPPPMPVSPTPEPSSPPPAAAPPVLGDELERPAPAHSDEFEHETAEYNVEAGEPGAPRREPGGEPAHAEPGEGEDVLEETPDFLQDTPDHDRLWFEQRPPRDFDFDG